MQPSNEQDLAEILRTARDPLWVRGGGTRGIAGAGKVLHTGGLSGISLYEPGALTLVAGAGTLLAEVEAVLAGEGQRLAFEPPEMCALLGREGRSTIGGVVGDNASGPRRVQAGACRDSLIGIRMVDGSGTVIKNGGRVMKNVTGYDLVKLMAGSRGTLGVLSEVSFKVQARPEAEATLCITGLGARAGLALLRKALGSPYDISGAAHVQGAPGEDARTLIRVEGLAGSVDYRATALRMLCGDSALAKGDDSSALWRSVRDVTPFVGQAGAVWRASVRPTLAHVLPEALETAGIAHRAIWDWGGGRLWLLAGAEAAPVVAAAIEGIGHATLVRALPGMVAGETFPPEPAGIAALTGGLRAAFDPRGILNGGAA